MASEMYRTDYSAPNPGSLHATSSDTMRFDTSMSKPQEGTETLHRELERGCVSRGFNSVATFGTDSASENMISVRTCSRLTE